MFEIFREDFSPPRPPPWLELFKIEGDKEVPLPSPFTNYYLLKNRDFCETEDMI